MKKQFFSIGAVAALTAFATPAIAAEAEVKADVDLPKAEAQAELKRDRDGLDRDTTIRADLDRQAESKDKVRHSNKASGVLGMEVRNSSNEKLGEIKDLVMDMNTGKVSYSVLAVGGFLGIGEKLIALPPSALKVANDGEYLILNVDKSKIEAAPGFAATAWPSPQNPEFEKFWETSATGSPAGSETQRDRSVDLNVDTDASLDRDRKSFDGEVKIDTDRKLYTEPKDRDVEVKIERE